MMGRATSQMAAGAAVLATGLLFAVLAFAIVLEPDGSIGARLFPLLASLSLVLLGTLDLLGVLRAARIRPSQAEDRDEGRVGDVLALLLLAVAYVWLTARLGYLVPTAIAAPVALWLFGIRSWLGLLVAAVLCPLAYHWIFFVGLGVFPPYGEWFDLMFWWRG